MRALRAWSVLLNVLLYPSTWAHEQTHYLVYRRHTSTVERDYEPTQEDASIRLKGLRGMPRWQYVLGALAPTLVGLLCALVAVTVSFTTLYPAPAAVQRDLVEWLVVGGYWFTYTIPSTADIETAISATRGSDS